MNKTMPATVLIVDDEKDVVELVRYHAEKAGLACLSAGDGPAALRLVRERRPDLVILDLLLPGLDGFDVCRQLRRDAATADLPIIMLTARADEVDRVVGLEVGADDYVVKPLSPRELIARIKAVLRRVHGERVGGGGPRRIGAAEVDEGRHQVTLAGAPVELTAQEFGLLAALVEARGRVL
jgi:DNA-binding response OmpR family regulator